MSWGYEFAFLNSKIEGVLNLKAQLNLCFEFKLSSVDNSLTNLSILKYKELKKQSIVFHVLAKLK